ncbi:hypothetical protein CEXT_598291 [Caerostris extrusa]|uniref:Uncharacterized protein n=1 Tax=Caerostris extrusa TaxID=172846 RepID=A0AAV4Q876_CAEEX|nr:hypothetical protein CEXT_598291 [Caerostris extrusa]
MLTLDSEGSFVFDCCFLGKAGLADLHSSLFPLSLGKGVKWRVLMVTFRASFTISDKPAVILCPSSHHVVRPVDVILSFRTRIRILHRLGESMAFPRFVHLLAELKLK